MNESFIKKKQSKINQIASIRSEKTNEREFFENKARSIKFLQLERKKRNERVFLNKARLIKFLPSERIKNK